MEIPIELALIADVPGRARRLLDGLGRGARFTSVLDAIAAHLSSPFDVVIVDLDRHDGLGFDSLVRAIDRIQGARILASSQELDAEIGAAAVFAGASGLLPLTPSDRANAIRRARDGELVLPDDHLSLLVSRVRASIPARPACTDRLTQREHQILRLLASGESATDVAAALHIGVATVRSHMKSVHAKLGVHSTMEAVRLAWRLGLAPMPIGA